MTDGQNSASVLEAVTESVLDGMYMLETFITYDPPFMTNQAKVLAESGESAFMMGTELPCTDLDKVLEYVRSRLWFTYRRNFAPIGGTGPDSDQGWGCMLRCAQMLIGETLIRRHIGKNFHWIPASEQPKEYQKVLEMFMDDKKQLYSIHQIAQMGVSEGKNVGEWFGPNTAAQVLKKLSVFDTWSNLAVHVALDNILVTADVNTIATMQPSIDTVKHIIEDGQLDDSPMSIMDLQEMEKTVGWRPLLLVIPLRLGLTNINRCYLPAIQEFFKLDSCVGIIGGRPNHALYFVGIAGDRLLYLDPHYCRDSLSENSANKFVEMYDVNTVVENAVSGSPVCRSASEDSVDDSTFHCDMLLHMAYDQVDPSLALAFFCESADAFQRLSTDLKDRLFPASSPPMFEQLEKRPKYWPPFEPYTGVKARLEMKEFDDMCEADSKLDDDFEDLGLE